LQYTYIGNSTYLFTQTYFYLIDFLQENCLFRICRFLLNAFQASPSSNRIICSTAGTSVVPRNLLRTFDRLIEKAGLPKIRSHDLRHTHASLLIYQNEPMKLISERMGHSKITTTMDTYGHLMANMQRDASDKLDKTLFGS
jgi:integrase